MGIFAIFAKAVKFAKLLPVIIILMRATEEAIPGEYTPEDGDTRTKGEIKLATFRAFLEEFWQGAEDSFGDFNTAWPFIERIVNRFAPMLFTKKA
ncbi:MAG: hypothetical protein ACPGVG_17425 [Mycobacterium sp.]